MAPRKGQMSDEHKAALAEGRAQGRAVRAYLDALEANKPKRGRKRSPEKMQARIAEIDASIADADPMSRLSMAQERIDLEAALGADEETVDLDALEAEFVAAAKAYGTRRGISYAAWRAVGVAPATLKKAGISRAG